MSDEILISRKEAIAAGLKFYFTGKPCKRGHVSPRRVDSKNCVACNKQWRADNLEHTKQQAKQWRADNLEHREQYRKQYYQDNEGYIKQYRKQYYQDNIEAIQQRNKQYYQENDEVTKQRTKQWREDNAEVVRQYRKDTRVERAAQNAIYRATKLQATPPWAELDLILRVYEKRDELNSKWGTDYEVDHIIPLQSKTVCGLHVWANLQLLESKDNASKLNNYQQDW